VWQGWWLRNTTEPLPERPTVPYTDHEVANKQFYVKGHWWQKPR
jgi:hypothetical protein